MLNSVRKIIHEIFGLNTNLSSLPDIVRLASCPAVFSLGTEFMSTHEL
jgi:hypothetical protein